MKPIDVPALLTTLLPMLCVLILLVAMSGCARKAGIGIEAACEQWDYLYASRSDSLGTVGQIYVNNVKREAFCRGT